MIDEAPDNLARILFDACTAHGRMKIQYIKVNGILPSFKIRRSCDFAPSLVWYHLGMWEDLSYLPKDDTAPLPFGEWFYELSSNISQRYYHLQHNGADYILYLRGRWGDFWQAYVIRNADNLAVLNEEQAVWSIDIFKMQNIRYTAEELELAKARVIGLFYEFDGTFPELRTILLKLE